MIERETAKKEFIEIIFKTKETNKRINYDIDCDKNFVILNGKSGIYDKSCFPKQEINLKKIVNHALNDSNVKFKKGKNTIKNSDWKITKEQILDNALCYLSNKGVTINNPYCNETDKRLFRRIISKILIDYIVPAIYNCNDDFEMKNNDDISGYFDKAIEKIKKIYTNDNMDKIMYEWIDETDYEVIGNKNSDYSRKIAFREYIKYLLFKFDYPTNTRFEFAVSRFEKDELNLKLKFGKESDTYFLPRYFLFYYEKINDARHIQEEIDKYIIFRACHEIGKKYASNINNYYFNIFSNIKDFAERILTIDYKRISQNDIKDVSDCKIVLGQFEINIEEIWRFLDKRNVSDEGKNNYIRALIEKIVSVFCNSLNYFCNIITPVKKFSKNNSESNKDISFDDINSDRLMYNMDWINTVIEFNESSGLYKISNEMSKSFYNKEIHDVLIEIRAIINSDEMNRAIDVYSKSISLVPSIYIEKSIILPNTNADSMYWDSVKFNENKGKIKEMRYNMFADLKRTLEKLIRH